jgi:pyruvate-formate lyase
MRSREDDRGSCRLGAESKEIGEFDGIWSLKKYKRWTGAQKQSTEVEQSGGWDHTTQRMCPDEPSFITSVLYRGSETWAKIEKGISRLREGARGPKIERFIEMAAQAIERIILARGDLSDQNVLSLDLTQLRALRKSVRLKHRIIKMCNRVSN